MGTIDFFSNTPRMRGYQGDTFPLFTVTVIGGSGLDASTMLLVLERKDIPGSAAFTKECNYFERDDKEGYTVRLTSSDTAQLCGTYTMHFIMTDANDREYRKLVGTLEVLPSPPLEVM